MPEPGDPTYTYEDHRAEFRRKLAECPVREEDCERMASILATIQARKERANASTDPAISRRRRQQRRR